MITLGLDLSMTCPGLTIYSGDASAFEFEKCCLYYRANRKPIEWRNILGSRVDDRLGISNEERWDNIAQWAMRCVNSHRQANEPVDAFIEDFSYGSKGMNFGIAENAAITKHYLWKAGAAVLPVSPSVIKKHYTGKGNADKLAMYKTFVLETRLNLMEVFQPKAETVGSPVGDLVDSYALARYGVMGGKSTHK